MKRSIFFVFILVLTLSLFTGSCKKYEDGPSFTLLSKKNRITGDWVIQSGLINKKDGTMWIKSLLGADYMWQIKEDGTYNEKGNFPDAGVWDLIDKKTKIEFKSFNDTIRYSIKILRLTKDEFWYEQVNNTGDIFEVHMIQ